MKNKTSSLKIGIGTPTILMIFVVLCMVILSVLSYMEASTNAKLSEKEVIYNEKYYQATTTAELVLHELRRNQTMDIAVYIKDTYGIDVQESDTVMEYYVTIDDKKELHIVIDKTDLSKVQTWKVITKEER